MLIVGDQSVVRKPVVWQRQGQFVLADSVAECSVVQPVGKPMVGQLVGQAVFGIVVGTGLPVEWWSVVREPFVGQW